MVERGSGYSALDSRLPSCQFMVCDCVVEGAEFPIPPGMATMDMVLVGDHWCAV